MDGNGLDFDIPGGGALTSLGPVLDNVSLAGAHATYTFDTTGALPPSAPVVRLAVAPVSEPALRDLAARLGMTGALQVVRDGGQWEYSITATEITTGTHVTLESRGNFSYGAPDPGARCGETGAPPRIVPTPLTPPVVPATATATAYGAGSDLCTNRAPAPDETHAIAAARDFLTNAGFLPDASTPVHVLPPPLAAPTLRPVQWAATAPNGGLLIGRDAQMDTVIMVSPDNRVVNATGTTRTPDAISTYPLRPAAELAAALQAGDAYVSLTLPQDASAQPIIFQGNDALAVHITAAALGYALAYTFDARPYLLPVLIYTGTASNAAAGGAIGFTTYVDAVARPAPMPVPVTATAPLPATPDLTSLASFTFTPLPFTRDEFDALARALGYDNATTTVETVPAADANAMRARYADGSTLGVNFQSGGWAYDSPNPPADSPITIGPNDPAPSRDSALAMVQQFIAAHHVNLDDLDMSTITQSPPMSHTTIVCYPLLLTTLPVVRSYGGDADCGITALVESGNPNHLEVQANALLIAVQRGGVAAIQSASPVGNGVITAQQALDALALAPPPNSLNANPSIPQSQLARLYVTDDPENALHRRGNTTILALTRGQAAPNQFTVTSIELVYVRTSLPTNMTYQQMDQLQPVWRIAGQIDIGDRHRIAPFVYLSPATR